MPRGSGRANAPACRGLRAGGLKAEKAAPLVLAGQGLFLDRFTPHRAVENHSGRTRWSLVVRMKSDRPPSKVWCSLARQAQCCPYRSRTKDAEIHGHNQISRAGAQIENAQRK